MNHDETYPAEYLAGILKEVKTIAMVGASSDPTKFSYGGSGLPPWRRSADRARLHAISLLSGNLTGNFANLRHLETA